jgi:hypothetical protein
MVIDISEIGTSRAGQKLSRCSSSISSGAAASATAVTVPLVANPIEYSCPVSRVDSWPRSLIRATRSAATVCSPIAGTAPTTSTASSEPSSPKLAGTSNRAATTLSR